MALYYWYPKNDDWTILQFDEEPSDSAFFEEFGIDSIGTGKDLDLSLLKGPIPAPED